MMSYTASVALSHPVLSLCCIEPGPSRGAVLSGRISTVAMSRSGQLGRLEIKFKPIQIIQALTASNMAFSSWKFLNKNMVLKISER
jgi:hypothetical protein